MKLESREGGETERYRCIARRQEENVSSWTVRGRILRAVRLDSRSPEMYTYKALVIGRNEASSERERYDNDDKKKKKMLWNVEVCLAQTASVIALAP